MKNCFLRCSPPPWFGPGFKKYIYIYNDLEIRNEIDYTIFWGNFKKKEKLQQNT